MKANENKFASDTVAPQPAATTSANDLASGLPAQSSMDWGRLIQRSLRGRYRLTLMLVSTVAILGFVIGWQWTSLQYRSEGMVRIASALPPVLKQTDQNQPIPLFDSFIQAQQELVKSRAVLEAACSDPMWKTKALIRHRVTVEDLAAGLKVDVRAKSENLRISYTDTSPVLAVAAVRATIAAYQNAYTSDLAERENRRIQLLEEYRASLNKQLETATFAWTQSQPRAVAPATQPAKSGPAARPIRERPKKPSEFGLAQIDPEMRRLLELRAETADQVERERLTFGTNHPRMKELEKALEIARRRIDRRLDDYQVTQEARYLEELRNDELAAAGESVVPPIVNEIPIVIPMSPAITQLRGEIEDVTQRVELLKTEASAQKRFEIVKSGEFPVVVPDRRVKTAATASAGGAGLAFVVMVLAGLMRRDYVFCADVVDDLATTVPYVAALPELDANDMLHWADAVQCVHHLRQSIETNQRSYMVSSASWGSGQSSVIMSLALSMAAAGVRTLVVDADIESKGLTKSLKLENEMGFADVISGCELAYCVKTNRHGLSILSAGLSGGDTGLHFTQAQFASVLQQARLHFDVILIDTAPVLSGAEPGLIARSVDGVLLTLARGQSRKLITRAIRELLQARATIIGSVFNRVSSKDFDLSIPQRAKPSVAGSAYRLPEALGELGPLVRAMATAVRAQFDLKRYVDVKDLTGPRLDVEQQHAESIAA